MRHRSLPHLGVAGALLVIDVLLPSHLRAGTILLFAGYFASVGLASVRRNQPRTTIPWYLLIFTTVAASAGIAFQVATGHTAMDMPVVSNLLILVGLLSWGAAFALFVRARTRTLDRYQVLDLGIFLVSATVAIKRVALDPALAAHPPVGMSPEISMGFILIEFVCFVLLVRFATLPDRRPTSLWLLIASLAASLLGSVLSNVLTADVSIHISLFISGTLTMLACAHPSMRDMTEPATGQPPSFGVVRAGALGVALLLAPLSAALVHARTDELHLGWFLAPTFVVTGLVLVRLRLLFDRERQAQADLAASQATFRSLVHGITDVILVLGRDGTIGYASASSATTLGRPSELLVDRPLGSVLSAEDVPLALSVLAATWGTGAAASVQAQVLVGSRLRTFELALTDHVAEPNVRGVVAVLHDVTERNELEARLRHQAMHDALTGLPNRVLMAERLAEAAPDGDDIGVLFVDLDDFKAVNDGLGHEIGDRLLRAVAHRLRAAVREEDMVARLGGDEFAVIVAASRAREIARRLLDALVEPFELGGHRIAIGASIGVTSIGATPDELLRNADMAMYTAKSDGKGALAVFEPTMQARATERLGVQLELADALVGDQLRLVYQPVFSLSTGRLASAEALLRWQHPTRGLLPPDRFIGVAEETGLIVPIGRWVLAEACRQAAEWPDDVDVAVNLSARQLESESIIQDVLDAVHDAGLRPGRLVLEITETMLARDMDATAVQLSRLSALGVRIAIDDFGTGYSSLSTLSRFPVDVLKIDRSFVASMVDNPEAAALVRVLVEMGRALRLDVVAEGIEDEDQAEALREQLCDLGQGFYFSRPLDPLAFSDLLGVWSAAPVAG